MTPAASCLAAARLLGIPASLCLGSAAWAAEPKAAAHHHAAVSGVLSLDVYAEDRRLHLLTGETAERETTPALLYRKSGDGGATWAPPVRVDAGLAPPFSLHRGGDAQVAAAADRLVAAWTTAGTDAWGSGPIATAVSDDGGQTWRAGPNPADDGSTTGHGFLDLATDRAGVFHLTWLDSRDGKQGLRYARSADGGATWSANITAKAATCECCPNALLAGPDGNVAILFRDHDPRDMRLVRSRDQGRRWLPPVAAGAFDWQFQGCPHAGGGLAMLGSGASAVFHTLIWTGKPGRAGVYHVSLSGATSPGSEPTPLGDPTSSHPDLAAGEPGLLCAVWDSAAGGAAAIWGATPPMRARRGATRDGSPLPQRLRRIPASSAPPKASAPSGPRSAPDSRRCGRWDE
jgi:hypothetical protein